MLFLKYARACAQQVETGEVSQTGINYVTARANITHYFFKQ